jgi:hypothetical protein
MKQIDRRRPVVGKSFTYFVCDVHNWDFGEDDPDDVCPVCLGEENMRRQVVVMIRALNNHMTHSERCLPVHSYVQKLLNQLGENYDAG